MRKKVTAMKYRDISGYKYQLEEKEHFFDQPLKGIEVRNVWDRLGISIKNGTVSIRQSFRWDGPSGPTFDTPTFMRGALIHDALYKLIRHKFAISRAVADKILRVQCKKDGMGFVRRWYVWFFVRLFGWIVWRTRKRTRDLHGKREVIVEGDNKE